MFVGGEPFYTPAHNWTNRYGNHLAPKTLQAVLVDLKRHMSSNFKNESPTLCDTVSLKYILDSKERDRFNQQTHSARTPTLNPQSPKTVADASTQTERIPYKRNLNSDSFSKLQEAKDRAKKKREVELEKAYSVLKFHNSEISGLSKFVPTSKSDESYDVASKFNSCSLKK